MHRIKEDVFIRIPACECIVQAAQHSCLEVPRAAASSHCILKTIRPWRGDHVRQETVDVDVHHLRPRQLPAEPARHGSEAAVEPACHHVVPPVAVPGRGEVHGPLQRQAPQRRQPREADPPCAERVHGAHRRLRRADEVRLVLQQGEAVAPDGEEEVVAQVVAAADAEEVERTSDGVVCGGAAQLAPELLFVLLEVLYLLSQCHC